MKLITLSTQLVLSLVCSTAIAMENKPIVYHQATNKHAQRIVDVINNHAVADNTKIVILPESFRSIAVEQDIARKRLYCATTLSDELVAFKKLFIIKNKIEHTNIITNEIRCTDNNPCLKMQIFNSHNNCISLKPYQSSHELPFANNLTLYFGGDYTVPAYRNQKINSNLTHYAFDAIKQNVFNSIKENNFDNIVLLYGLTKANAGETEGGIDRTPSIVRAFKNFAQQVATESLNDSTMHNSIVIHHQYEAFMPTFDPKSTECVPLADDKAIPGFGNVLFFPLNNTDTQ